MCVCEREKWVYVKRNHNEILAAKMKISTKESNDREKQKRNVESWDRSMCGWDRKKQSRISGIEVKMKKTKRELQMKVAKAENVHSNQEEEARTRESA